MWICNTRTTPPMERAHRPRPFGCGLRACTEPAEVVTVKSGRTQTVVDPGRMFSFFVAVVATTTSDSGSTGEGSRAIGLRLFGGDRPEPAEELSD